MNRGWPWGWSSWAASSVGSWKLELRILSRASVADVSSVGMLIGCKVASLLRIDWSWASRSEASLLVLERSSVASRGAGIFVVWFH